MDTFDLSAANQSSAETAAGSGSDLFADVGDEALPGSPGNPASAGTLAVTETAPVQPATSTDITAANIDQPAASLATFSTDTSAATTLGTTAVTGQTDVLSDQLTTTLTAANGPPTSENLIGNAKNSATSTYDPTESLVRARAASVDTSVSGSNTGPGRAATATSYAGDHDFEADGTTPISVTGATLFDTISVSGNAALGGTLNVSLSGFAPTLGQTFAVMTYTSSTGDFDTFTGYDLGMVNGTHLYLKQNVGPTSLTLEVVDKLPAITFGSMSITVASAPDRTALETLFRGSSATSASINFTGIIQVDEFFVVSGSFTITRMGGTQNVTLGTGYIGIPGVSSTISNVAVTTWTLGAFGVHAFVGIGGPDLTDANNDGLLQNGVDTKNDDAVGFAVDGLSFGVVMMKTTSAITNPLTQLPEKHKFKAIVAKADFAGLIGMDSVVALQATGVSVEVNTSKPWRAVSDLPNATPFIDFQSSFGSTGFEVPGSADLSKNDATNLRVKSSTKLLTAAADRVLLQISDYVHVSGGFSLTKGVDRTVTVNTGLTTPISGLGDFGLNVSTNSAGQVIVTNLPVQMMSFGLSDAEVFIGYTDGLSMSDGRLTTAKLNDKNAIGLFLEHVDLGLVIMKTNLPALAAGHPLAGSKFTAAQLDATSVGFVGIPEFALTASQFELRLNTGKYKAETTFKPVVDFVATFGAGGYEVRTSATGTKTVAIKWQLPLLGFSSDRAVIQISDYIFISGGFSLDKGSPVPVTVTVKTGTTLTSKPELLTTITNGITPSDNYATLSNVPVQVLQLGFSNVNVFIGSADVGTPTGTDPDTIYVRSADGILSPADLDAANATGVYLTNMKLGLVVMRPDVSVGNALKSAKFTALQLDAQSAGLIGVPEFELFTNDLQVRLNRGRASWYDPDAKPEPAVTQPFVDFSSFGATGYVIRTSTSGTTNFANNTVALKYTDPLLGVSANNVLLRISNYVYITGGFSFNKGLEKRVTINTGLTGLRAAALQELNDLGTGTLAGTVVLGDAVVSDSGRLISNVKVQAMELGLSQVDVFVGYLDSSISAGADGTYHMTESQLNAAHAIGLFVHNFNLGLVMMNAMAGSTSVLKGAKFTALQIKASTFALLGVPEFDLRSSELQIRVNKGTGKELVFGSGADNHPVVDFTRSFPDSTGPTGDSDTDPDGYRIATDTSRAHDIVLLYDQPVIGASADQALLKISDYVYVVGGFSFNKGATTYVDVRTGIVTPNLLPSLEQDLLNTYFAGITDSTNDPGGTTLGRDGYQTIWNLPVATTEIGLSNVNVFVGYSDSLTAAAADYVLTQAELSAAHAVGFFVNNANLGMVLMKAQPTGRALDLAHLKFYAFQGTADGLGLIGVPEVTLEAFGAELSMNQGSFDSGKWPVLSSGLKPVVDFKHSFPDSTGAAGDADTDPDGYRIPTDTSRNHDIVLLFDQQLIAGGAQRTTIQLSQFVHVTGSFHFEFGPVIQAKLVDGLAGDSSVLGLPASANQFIGPGTKDLQTFSIGASNVHAFVGLDGPYWEYASNGSIVAKSNSSAVGLIVEDMNLGMLMARPTNFLDPIRYYAANASATQISLVGFGGVNVVATGRSLELSLNTNTPAAFGLPLLPVIDFTQLPDHKFAVKTGAKQTVNGVETDVTIDLAMSTPLLRAQGQFELNLLGLATFSGNLAFELGPRQNVKFGSSDDTTSVSTLSVGGSNLNAFVGVNGPYVRANGTTNSSAVGLAVTNAGFGLLVMKTTSLTDPGLYLAGKIKVPQPAGLSLVGIPGVTVNGGITMEFNFGADSSGPRAVNLKTSFPAVTGTNAKPAGYQVNTGPGGAPVTLDFEGTLVHVEVGGHIILGGVFDLQGALVFTAVDATINGQSVKSIQVAITATATLGPIAGLQANGALLIDPTGLVGRVELTASLDANNLPLPIAGAGLNLTGRFLLEVNTASAAKELTVLDFDSTNSTGPLVTHAVTIQPGILVRLKGTMVFVNLLSAGADLTLFADGSGVRFDGKLTLSTLFITTVAQVNFLATSAGVQLKTEISLDTGKGLAGGAITLKGDGILVINTTNFEYTPTIPGNLAGKSYAGKTAGTYGAHSARIDLHGNVSIVDVFSFETDLLIQVGGGAHAFGPSWPNPVSTDPGWVPGIRALDQPTAWDEDLAANQFAVMFSAGVNFFGIATVGTSGWFNSKGDFALQFNGGIQIGSSGFGIYGNFSVHAARLGSEDTTTHAVTHQLSFGGGGGAGITLFGWSVGGFVSFDWDNGVVSVTGGIHLDFFFFDIDIDHTFTVGYFNLPAPVYLGATTNSNGTLSNSDGGAVGADGLLTLNMGARGGERQLAGDVIDETFIISHPNGASSDVVEVTAFGRTQTFTGVTRIVADGGSGSDNIIVKEGVAVSLDLRGGPGQDAIVVRGAGGSNNQIDGGDNDDYIEIGAAVNVPFTIRGGSDVQTLIGVVANNTTERFTATTSHGIPTGTPVVVSGTTLPAGITAGTIYYARAVSPTELTLHTTRKGATDNTGLVTITSDGTAVAIAPTDNDTITWYFGNVGPTIQGGAGSDKVIVNGSTSSARLLDAFDSNHDGILDATANAYLNAHAGDTGTVSRGTGLNSVEIKWRETAAASNTAITISAVGIENLEFNLGVKTDALTINDLADSGVTDIAIDTGRNPKGKDAENNQLYEVSDSAVDSITLFGGPTADRFDVVNGEIVSQSYPATAQHPAIPSFVTDVVVINRSVTYGYSARIVGAAWTENDTLTINGMNGDDVINGSGVTKKLIRMTYNGGAGNDTLVGTPFDDYLNSGDGDDTVTGGRGFDVFTDTGGFDTLIETIETTGYSFGLYGNRLITGVATLQGTGENQMLANFTSATDENIDGLFERVQLNGDGSANIFAVGSATSQITVNGSAVPVTARSGIVTLTGAAGDDIYLLESNGLSSANITVVETGTTAVGGTDVALFRGTSVVDHLEVSLDAGSTKYAIKQPGLLDAFSSLTVPTTVESAEIYLLGSDDVAAIRGLTVPTTFGAGAGSDTINIGSSATFLANTGGNLNSITAGLIINGDAGTNAVNFDDTADTAANSGTLTSTQLTGLGMGVGVTYRNFATLNLNLGAGGDTLTVVSTHVGLTHIEGRGGNDQFFVRTISGRTEIDGQEGSDTFTIGNATLGAFSTVDGIQALLVLNGGTDPVVTGTTLDVLNITEENEAASASALGTLQSNHLAGLGMAADGVDYTNFEALNITLGQGNDTFVVESTHTGVTTLKTGAGNDTVNIATISGETRVRGEAGDDTIKVNVDASGNERRDTSNNTINGVGGYLDLDGDAGSDKFIVYLAGAAQSSAYPISLINVHDTEGTGGGTNSLEIYGTDKENVSDNFLVRRNFIALLPTGGTAERINYDGSLNGGVSIFARAGNDFFAFDDNSTTMTVDGGDGEDVFQVGQMFQSDRVPNKVANFVAATSGFEGTPGTVGKTNDTTTTINTTQGYLTPGVSFETTINGKDGNDRFIVYSNKAELNLNGDDGDDSFEVRAFALVTSQGGNVNSSTNFTKINAGLGADYVEYNINAKVNVDGGDGLDKLVIVGTEFSDTFTITATQITGAGISIEYKNIERVDVDTMEGNDTIIVLSTRANVVYYLFGGLGSDVFNIGAAADATSGRSLAGIQGPVYIEGGIDPTADRSLANPLMYLGETNPNEHVVPNDPIRTANLTAIEADQVDSIWVYNNDAATGQVGTLTGSRLSGLGMGGDITLRNQPFAGGITYSNLEMVAVYLGTGADTLEVQNTHGGETLVDGGGGNDAITVRSVVGHTTVAGGAGNDTITLGSPVNSKLTIDRLRALVTIDGGAATDIINIDDGADTNNNLGTLDTTTLTGLDLLEARVRTIDIRNARSGSFKITVDGRTTDDLSLIASSLDIRAALLALNVPGVTDVAVNRAGNFFTLAFAGDENLAAGAVAVSVTGKLVQNGNSPVQIVVSNSVPNRVQTISVPAVSGTFTVNIASGQSFSVTAGASADSVRDAIIQVLNPSHALAGIGIKDILVSQYGSTYEVVFQGLLAGTRGAGQTFSVAPRVTSSTTTFSINAVAGTFQLNLAGVSTPTAPLAWNASASDVEAALRALMGSNAITVSRTGSTYAVAGLSGSLGSVDDRNLIAPIAIAERTSGVNYFGSETLNLTLGSGSDVLNIRGTSAATNVFASEGDDRVYVSSLANETLTSKTDFLLGNLDRILGTLNLDLGTGRHVLMISDEAALAGDGTTANPVRITDQPVAGLGLPPTEITITGLTPAPAITYKAAATGNFADGITIWTGWGADTITVDGTHQRGDGAIGSLRTITTLNTGLGNDNVTVGLNTSDGFFVLNTQGPYNAYDGLVSDKDTVNAAASTRSLIIFGGQDADTITGGQANDLIFGDRGLVTYYNGTTAVTVLGNGGPGDRTDGVERGLGQVTTVAPTIGGADIINAGAGDDFVLGGPAGDTVSAGAGNDLVFGDLALLTFNNGVLLRAEPLNRDIGGADTLRGDDGDDMLIGGAFADKIDGGAGSDLIIGDNALLDRTTHLGNFTNALFETLSGAVIYDSLGNAMVDNIARNQPGTAPAWGDFVLTLLDHSTSVPANSTTFGNDYLAGGAGNDRIFGGLGDDTIQGDGSIDRVVSAVRDANGVLQISGALEATTDGDDYIEGNGGNDLIFGGLGQDDIIGGSSSLFGLTTPAMRPDGSDLIFGGAGVHSDREDAGDTSATGHARDADTIAGDNANIYRLIGTNGVAGTAYLTFAYDNYSTALRIIPRAVRLLDYTPGGLDLSASAASDIGAADEIHGEGGDDTIYGQLGNDVLYGDAQDDDIIGGTGNDWISGGNGDDGILGDDGRIFTSRIGTVGESLYGIAGFAQNQLNLTISTPGQMQVSVINVSGQLKKTAIVEPFMLTSSAIRAGVTPSNDIVFGGLGNDAIHGGAGDDALSGAEALPEYFAKPFNPGNVLGFGLQRAGEFAAYNEFSPLEKIFVNPTTFEFVAAGTPGAVQFILNFQSAETDGDDDIFGDVGNDWLVGGTGRDHLYGGYGDDLLNGDDNQDTNGGKNDAPDTLSSYEDIAFGGAGRDVLIGNTGGDRLIDWAGEFNSYLVPFAPFGAAAISRALQPGLMEYLYALSASDGADPTRSAKTGSAAARNGEPEGELGLVKQSDFDWQSQTGAPADPQPGNVPGGARDVLRSATFNAKSADGFAADSGTWEVVGGRLQVSPTALGGDAVSVFYVDQLLPRYYEVQATINAVKATGGYKANAFIIFDYQSPTNFKFAGIDVSLDKLQIGHRDASGWVVDVQTNMQVRDGQDYNMLLSVNGVTVTLIVDNNKANVVSYSFTPRTVDGYTYGLNTGMVGLGANNSRAQIDNVAVQVLPPTYTLQETENFSDGKANLLTADQVGQWTISGGRYVGTPGASGFAASNFSLQLSTSSLLQIDTTVKPGSNGTSAGVVFDYYDANNFKFAAIVAGSNQVVIGHHTRSGWTIDASASRTIAAGTDYSLSVTLKGTTVSVSLNGQAALGFVFNAAVVDAQAGLFTRDGSSSFASYTVKTDDAKFSATVTKAATGESIGGSLAGSGLSGGSLTSSLDDQTGALSLTTLSVLPSGMSGNVASEGADLFAHPLSSLLRDRLSSRVRNK